MTGSKDRENAQMLSQKILIPQILSLCHQGQTASAISTATGLPIEEVRGIIAEASARSRILFIFMDREKPATVIDVCGVTQSVQIINLTDNMLSRAFGVRENPDWSDYEDFLESRCMPRTRHGIRDELRELGVDTYDPFQIIEKTAGRVYGDGQWLRRMSQEWITQYDSIRESAPNETELRRRILALLKQESGKVNDERNESVIL